MGNPYGRPDGGFLEDYSGIAAAGSAFQGFAKGLEDAEDRNLKKMEFESKMKVQAQNQERESTEQALKLRMAGLKKAESGGLENDPESYTPKEQDDLALKRFGAGAKVGPDGKTLVFDPESAKALQLKNQQSIANQRFDMQGQRLGLQGQRMAQSNAKTEMQANQQYSQEMKANETQLLGSKKALSLVEGIKSGKLKSTPQLRSDLSAALGSLVNQGQPATVFSMSHQDFDSAWGRMQSGQQFLTGNTVDSMTKSQLQQLDLDIRAISHELAEQHQTKYEAFKEGVPDQFRSKLDNRFNKFRQGAGLVQTGIVPTGLVGQQAGPAQAPPKDPSKMNREELKAYLKGQ